MIFGKKIKELREERGLLQRQLSAALEIDTPMYSKIERGERKAKRSQIPIMAKLFDVEEKELLTIWLADKVLDTVEDASEVKNDAIAYVQNEIENGQRHLYQFLLFEAACYSYSIRIFIYASSDTQNVGDHDGDVSETKLTERQQKMLNLIKESPTITGKQMSETLSVSQRTIERDLSAMQKIGVLKREGKDNDGMWVINVG